MALARTEIIQEQLDGSLSGCRTLYAICGVCQRRSKVVCRCCMSDMMGATTDGWLLHNLDGITCPRCRELLVPDDVAQQLRAMHRMGALLEELRDVMDGPRQYVLLDGG